MITRVTTHDVLSGCRRILGLLPTEQKQAVDNQLLAGLLRRSAGIHCPCSRTTLRASILESLQHLLANEQTLPERVDAAIEGLIVGGDLLELNDVITEDTTARGSWVFAAPPSFVVRSSGSVFLLGIVADQDTFLPSSMADLIVHDGYSRMIPAQSQYDLAHELREQGLQQLTENAWLRSPERETAQKMLDRFERMLDKQPFSGSISDLSILDPERPVSYYRGRWTIPKDQTGTFVAKRPQEFGAAIWCFARLENGTPVRFLDLPLERSRWRGCDTAWHLSMAIDHVRGSAQRYRRTANGNGVYFDFFSPLPQWSQRRLMIFGRPVLRERSLFSYLLPLSEADMEEQHLQQVLWLSPTDDFD